MADDDLGPLASETMSVDDVKITDKVRTHNGYFKIDSYTLKHKKHEGGWSQTMHREVFERGHAVAVLLYDPDLDRLVFIEQFRIGAFAALASPWFDQDHQSPWLLECVAGIIDSGETPEAVAKRECLEEANCEVLDLIPMTHYFASPGGTSESVFMYCGRTDASEAGGVHGLDAEHEDLRVLSVPTDTALSWLDQGRFIDSASLIAMQWFKLNQENLKKSWS